MNEKSNCMTRRTFLAIAAALASIGASGCGARGSDGVDSAARSGEIDFSASFGDMERAEASDGSDAVVVEIAFENGSGYTTSIGAAYIVDAFQGGTALTAAETGRDLGEGLSTVVGPGESATVRLAYALIDESDVTVEVRKAYGSLDTEAEFARTFPLA